jgi:hypothetical protein
MAAYTSYQGTKILSNFKSAFAPKLSESLRDKVVEDVMRFPTQQRRQARLTQLIQKLDRVGVNNSDVVSILKKLKTHGIFFHPDYQKELIDLLKNNHAVGKSRKRKRSKKQKQTRKY